MNSAHEMSHLWAARLLHVPAQWQGRRHITAQPSTPWKFALIALTPVGIGAVLMSFFAWGWTNLAETFLQYLYAFSGLFFSFAWLLKCLLDIKYTWILLKTGEWPYFVSVD